MAESSGLLYCTCAEKVHEILIKVNQFGGKKKLFSFPHGTIHVVDFFFPLVPSKIYDVCNAIE